MVILKSLFIEKIDMSLVVPEVMRIVKKIEEEDNKHIDSIPPHIRKIRPADSGMMPPFPIAHVEQGQIYCRGFDKFDGYMRLNIIGKKFWDQIDKIRMFKDMVAMIQSYGFEPHEIHFSQDGVERWQDEGRESVVYLRYKSYGFELECLTGNVWEANIKLIPYGAFGDKRTLVDDIARYFGAPTEPLKVEYPNLKWKEILESK